MTNFEKCRQEFTIKDTLLDVEGEEYIDFCTAIRRVRGKKVCEPSCAECYKWLKKEYKPQILDKVEKRYLGNIIRPFRDKVEYIKKCKSPAVQKEYIGISIKSDSNIILPSFKENSMYKKMKPYKKYTLKELGI
jgi:hypothetical protein